MVHLGWHSPTSGLEGLTWAVECGYSCVARTRTPGVTLERGSFERFRGCTGEMIPRAPARGRRKASAFVEPYRLWRRRSFTAAGFAEWRPAAAGWRLRHRRGRRARLHTVRR